MKRSFWKSIRGKLVSRTLLVVLIPVLVLGGVAVAALTSLARSADDSVDNARSRLGEEVVGDSARHSATMVAADLAEFLNERIRDVFSWSRSPLIIDRAKAGAAEAGALGLNNLTIEEVEELYADDPQLGSLLGASELRTFLDESPEFKEVFFTEANGYNVTFSNKTSDMVQSDEEWWQAAWENGIHIDAPEFDESAGVFSVDISVRLDDGSRRVGVMKTSLDLQSVQGLTEIDHSQHAMGAHGAADESNAMAAGDGAMADGHEAMADGDGAMAAGDGAMADGHEAMAAGDGAMADGHEAMADMDPDTGTILSGFDFTIIDANGMLLAETSTGHSPDRIMNPDVNIADDPNPRIAVLAQPEEVRRADHPELYALTDDWVAGYAHVLDHFNAINTSDRVGPDDVGTLDWVVVAQQPTEQAFATLEPLEALRDDVSSTSSLLTGLLAVVAVAGVVAAVASSLIFSRRITRPILSLRDAAQHAANEALPDVVSKIDEIGPDEEIPTLEPVVLETGDEVEELAHSFNTVQQTAADLAVGQARLRRQNVATTFVSMGRRNQNLLAKQLEHINVMEQTERDSDNLRRLFQLDHLATRMRRNAESLLVLAGEETPRRFRAPVAIRQLVQAAGAEIEEFDRVEMGQIDEAAVEGGVASDVAHLLAELLENASRFSPPGSRIQVHGRRRPEGGYMLSIIDQGLGMEEKDLATANMRLSNPVEFDRAPSAYLGLFVVGHLARRHGLAVNLSDSPYGGLTATVRIPSERLVTPGVAQPQPVVVDEVSAEFGREVAVETGVEDAPAAEPVSPAEPMETEPALADAVPVVEPVADAVPITEPAVADAVPVVEAVADAVQVAEPWPITEPAVADAVPIAEPAVADAVPITESAPVAEVASASPPTVGAELQDPWFDAPEPPAPAEPAPVAEVAYAAPQPTGGGELQDPWFDAPKPPEPAGPNEATGPVEQTPAPASSGPTMGMPVTTTMPIPIPPEADPVRGNGELISPVDPPGWRRSSDTGETNDPPGTAPGTVPRSPQGQPAPVGYTAPGRPMPPGPRRQPAMPSTPPPVPDAGAMPAPPPPPPTPSMPSLAPPPPPMPAGGNGSAGNLTPSGFRRRRRGQEGAPVPLTGSRSDQGETESPTRPTRDADSVQASLARFRAGVTQGRAQVDEAGRRPPADGDWSNR